ncbi:MAG: hypothetical protein WC878_00555 [Candidatus Paceibacterota bacterium]|jgi:hypothetical protein
MTKSHDYAFVAAGENEESEETVPLDPNLFSDDDDADDDSLLDDEDEGEDDDEEDDILSDEY